MEDNSIQAFGSVFMTVKARDREVIVDENGYINYSKLMESITGNRDSFRGICRKNQSLCAHVLHHDKAKLEAWAEQELKKTKKSKARSFDRTSEIDDFLSSIKTIEIEALIEANILIAYSGSGNKDIRRCSGTYGPRYLLDFLLFNVDVSYYDSIHETIEALDAYAQTTNKSLAQELEELKKLYEFKTKELENESKAHEETKSKYDDAIAKINELIEDGKRKDEKIDELISQGYQQLGMFEEAAEERKALLVHDEARAKDNKLIKSKLNILCNKVSSLNASNYDEDGSIIFIWTLFRSESMRISYTKHMPEKAIWIYSSIREDKNKSIPNDAEILFEANVVSRSMYESLVRELEPMMIYSFYRHILISYENAIAFIDKLNELLDARGIHPETYNIEALSSDIETMKAEVELERKREERRAHQVSIRQHIIDEGKLYIDIYGRWRRLYNKNENDDLINELNASKFFYIRRGAGGTIVERVQSRTLENSRFRAQGDPRIRYE